MQETIRNNRLIAEFMQYEAVGRDFLIPLTETWFFNTYTFAQNRGTIWHNVPYYRVNEIYLSYSESFDWIMSAAKKCLFDYTIILDDTGKRLVTNIQQTIQTCEVKELFNAVVAFIEWRNSTLRI